MMASSHFTQCFLGQKSQGDGFLRGGSDSHLCGALGTLVPLLLRAGLCEGMAVATCIYSSLASARGHCVCVCLQGGFRGGPGTLHSWSGVQSSQKGEALILPSPSLVSTAVLLSPDLGLRVLVGYPKLGDAGGRGMCY